VIFTPKADSALSDIIKKYKLEEYKAMVKIDYISKKLARDEISDKAMSDYLQKELNISSQTADQVSNETIDNIIPFLVKAPAEKFKNPDFVEEISKKVFGEEKKPLLSSEQQKEKIGKEKDIGLFPKIKQHPTTPNKELRGRPTLPPKKSERIKKPVISESTSKTRQPSGPDNYREPIE